MEGTKSIIQNMEDRFMLYVLCIYSLLVSRIFNTCNQMLYLIQWHIHGNLMFCQKALSSPFCDLMLKWIIECGTGTGINIDQ